jgi:hypothetical protein
MTTAQRYFFLIDQQGIVRGKWRGETAELFSSGPILKVAGDLAQKR